MMILALIVFAAVLLMFMLSACKAASLADEQMERNFREWLSKQEKDTALTETR